MNTSKTLEREAVQSLATDLASHGYRGHGGVFTKSINSESSAWLGLNISRAHLNGGVAIAPVIGVVFDPIESQLREIQNERKLRPTLTSSLGYLMPQGRFIEWIFVANDSFDIQSEARKIVDASVEFGEPFVRKHASLVAVLECLEGLKFTDQLSASYRLPIAYQLYGQADKAQAYLSEKLRSLADRNDFAAQEMKHVFNSLHSGGTALPS